MKKSSKILEKSYTKCGGETIRRTFFKKIKIEYISGSIFEDFIHFVFIVCQIKGYRNILKLSCRPLYPESLYIYI